MINLARGALLFVTLAALTAGAAHADRERGRDRFERGTRYYNLGRFADALKEYEAAYLEYSDPTLLYNIGQCYRQMGEKEYAVRSYRSYLRSYPNAANRPEVEEKIDELEAALAKEGPRVPKTGKGTAPPVPVPTAPKGSSVASSGGNSSAALVPTESSDAGLKDRADEQTGSNTWLWVAVGAGAVAAVVVAALLVSGGEADRPPCPAGVSVCK